MTTTTITSRKFNQDTSGAKKAARKGPVLITDRGRVAHVLLTIDDFRRLQGAQRSIVDLLLMPGLADIAFDPPRQAGTFQHPADLS